MTRVRQVFAALGAWLVVPCGSLELAVGQTVTFYGSDAATPSVSTFDFKVFGENPLPPYFYGSVNDGTSGLNVTPPSGYVPGTLTEHFQSYYTEVHGSAMATWWYTLYLVGVFGDTSVNLRGDGSIQAPIPNGEFYANASPVEYRYRTTISTENLSFYGSVSGLAIPPPGEVATISGHIQGTGATTYAYSFVPETPYSSGSWEGGGSFGETSMPDGVGATVVFPFSAAGTVAVSGGRTVGNWLIAGSSPYTFTGPGSITLSQSGRAQVSVDGGAAHLINASLTLASDTSFYVNDGSQLKVAGSLSIGSTTTSIEKLGAGTLSIPGISIGALTVVEGRLSVNATGTVTRVSNVVVSGEVRDSSGTVLFAGGALDIAAAGSGLIVDYDETARLTPLGDYSIPGSLAHLVKNGYNGGNWSGAGTDSFGNKLPVINSSDAAGNGALAIGFGEASAILGSGGGTFLGQSVDASTVLLRVVLEGDANLDGTVNTADYSIFNSNYNATGQLWSDGDFNYDGTVNLGDYALLSANFNQTLPASLARGTIPEPVVGVTSLLALGLFCRCRRMLRA